MDRGQGYLIDVLDVRDRLASSIHGQEITPFIEPVSLKQFSLDPLFQDNSETCVAQAAACSIDMNLRVRGITDPPKAARKALYVNALLQERREAIARGEIPGPMVDRGCYPRLCMRAIQKLGFCDERFFPFDPNNVLEVPPPAVEKNSIDQAGFEYGRIVTSGLQRTLENATALHANCIPIFGIQTDEAFHRNSGETITSIDTARLKGSHMLCVVAVEYDEKGDIVIRFKNWWRDWGDNGYGSIRADIFGSSYVTDNYVTKTVPTFSTEAA